MASVIRFNGCDFLEYHTEFEVLICIQCHRGIAQDDITSHLQRSHKVHIAERNRLVEEITSRKIVDPENADRPPPETPPINGLVINNGFRCTVQEQGSECHFISLSWDIMRRHWNSHGLRAEWRNINMALSSTTSTCPVRCVKFQSFFGNRTQPFEVGRGQQRLPAADAEEDAGAVDEANQSGHDNDTDAVSAVHTELTQASVASIEQPDNHPVDSSGPRDGNDSTGRDYNLHTGGSAVQERNTSLADPDNEDHEMVDAHDHADPVSVPSLPPNSTVTPSVSAPKRLVGFDQLLKSTDALDLIEQYPGFRTDFFCHYFKTSTCSTLDAIGGISWASFPASGIFPDGWLHNGFLLLSICHFRWKVEELDKRNMPLYHELAKRNQTEPFSCLRGDRSALSKGNLQLLSVMEAHYRKYFQLNFKQRIPSLGLDGEARVAICINNLSQVLQWKHSKPASPFVGLQNMFKALHWFFPKAYQNALSAKRPTGTKQIASSALKEKLNELTSKMADRRGYAEKRQDVHILIEAVEMTALCYTIGCCKDESKWAFIGIWIVNTSLFQKKVQTNDADAMIIFAWSTKTLIKRAELEDCWFLQGMSEYMAGILEHLLREPKGLLTVDDLTPFDELFV